MCRPPPGLLSAEPAGFALAQHCDKSRLMYSPTASSPTALPKYALNYVLQVSPAGTSKRLQRKLLVGSKVQSMHRPAGPAGSMYMYTSHGLMHTNQEDICSPTAARSLQVAVGHSPHLAAAACCQFWSTYMPTNQSAALSAIAFSPASGALSPMKGCASRPPPAICRQRGCLCIHVRDQCITCRLAADLDEHPSSSPS